MPLVFARRRISRIRREALQAALPQIQFELPGALMRVTQADDEVMKASLPGGVSALGHAIATGASDETQRDAHSLFVDVRGWQVSLKLRVACIEVVQQLRVVG